MKTPIKSFEIIKEMYEYFVKKYRDLEPKLMICEKEDFDNVETALKENLGLKNSIDRIQKVFEILKKKKVNVWTLLETKTCAEYNFKEVVIKPKRKLTQEEYDLLKEVL